MIKGLSRPRPARPLASLAALVVLSAAAIGAAPLAGCASGSSHVAISPGPMPEGKAWTAVWFNRAFGNLHLEEQGGNAVRGRWNQGEKWGELTGTKDGNVLHFEWKETNTVFVGANAVHSGKGYFQMVAPENGSGPAKLKGMWGYKDSETDGGNWEAIEQLGVKSDPDSVKAVAPNAAPASKDTWE